MNHVLIIGHVWVEPKSSAAGSRMMQLIALFLSKKWEVTFSCSANKNENSTDLKSIGVNEVFIELNSVSFDIFITKLCPDIVLFDRFMTEEQFSWRVTKHCPKALKILNTEDLHLLRKIRHSALKKGIEFSTYDLLQSNIAKREIASILRCDVSLIISTYEIELLKTIFKIDEKLYYYLPFLLPRINHTITKNWNHFKGRNHFIFVGNFLHLPNVDTVLQLKNHIWDSIKKQLPTAELHIYGAYITPQIEQLHNPKKGFIIKGFINDIYKTLKNAKVMIAPIRFGAGIKGKFTDAMLCGTPIVTTKIGAEGMCKNIPWSGFIENDTKKFITKAIELYSDEYIWNHSQQNGITIINDIYNKEKLGMQFIKKIKELQKNLESHRIDNFIGNMLQYHQFESTKYLSKWIEMKNKYKNFTSD